ncbi:acyltransferase domain-containing protein [Streptomyces sp. NBC_00285]|uniref:beta-ketoacyl synthase N-terminal-like domain-containing protein n=1 Tax=Streptomyces sp. NBC_00285 TaxID=2975700 RepID=UPI002E28B3EC|nr:beta-ketoacyl synthase N-terminal-like domain-containing protein [Streptomyces sp. NBC_00285]
MSALPADRAGLLRLVVERIAHWSGVPGADIEGDRPLAELGLSSRGAVAIAGELADALGRELPATLLWETPTVNGLVTLLSGGTAPGPEAVHLPWADTEEQPVAVVGIGCRLPGGVRGPDEYWRLLVEGADAVGRVSEERRRDFVAPAPSDVSPWGGYLDDATLTGFDSAFFRIPPREADAMDPQQRMLLEVAQEALDHAAIPAASLAGTATGVFVGVSAPDYGRLTGADPAAVDAWATTGAATSVAAGRLSYVYDLRGPSVVVDTACSSSLVAVHQACVALRGGDCDSALVGGANVLLSPVVTVAFGQAGVLAPDGRCKPFSASADGIGRAEGCAVVVLKRFSDALRDGDRVLAVITATAVNSDGRSNGLTAPNPAAQRALLETAYARADIDPAIVDYVEAHGTGTPLGDPIEAGALAAVLGRTRHPDQPLLLGSVKSNLGHLEAAAGLAGLVKAVLALHHGVIPGSLHCDQPALDEQSLRVVTEPEPWPRYGGTATAGVSAFGFGGTNAHAVLEEWQPCRPAPVRTPLMHGTATLVQFSDVDPARVRHTAGRLADWLDTPDGSATRLQDVGRTLAGRAGRGPARAAVVAPDCLALTAALRALSAGRPHPYVSAGNRDRLGPGPVWVFSGYGTQWPAMGRQLLGCEPAFAAAVEKLEPVLAAGCGISLHELLDGCTEDDLRRVETAQPLLYGTQLALAELWRSYGVEPAAVIGHSMGEVAAAVVAGALDPADGARVIAVRSRLLATLRGGAMAVVDLTDDELGDLVRQFPGVHVAVHTSPGQKTVTGAAPAVSRFVEHLTAHGRTARVMPVQGAGHSPQVEPLLAELVTCLSGVRGRTDGAVRVYSTVYEDPTGPCDFDAAHWAANLRNPVRLAGALAAAAADGHTTFIEISPHPVLLHPLAQNLPDSLPLPTLRRGDDPALTFRGQLAALYAAGHLFPARLLHPHGEVVDVPLPSWHHTRHWWTHGPGSPSADVTHDERALPAAESVPPPEQGSGGGTVAERFIRHIAAVTGHLPEQITPDTPLTDFGLDSLMAVRLREAAVREFGVPLSLSDLLLAGTVQAAANAITLSAQDDRRVRLPSAPVAPRPASRSMPYPLRALRPDGDRPPLILVHAAGGTPDVYRPLAGLLAPGLPVYGLDRVEEADTVAAKARLCAEAIRKAWPDGRYRIGGWSFGGFVAQETARLLAAEFAPPDAVVLIDAVRPLPRPPGRTAWDVAREHFEGFTAYVSRTYGARLDLPYGKLAGLDDRARIDLVLDALSAVADIAPAALEHQRTSYLDLRTGEAHTPRSYDGRVILYRATEPAPHTVRDPAYERADDALGWDELCSDLEIVRVPGHHLSLLDPPHAQVIADHLNGALG